MKEKKYKDIKGFENVNTFTQFDQYEAQRIQGGKNRFVYDFSFQTRPGFPDNFIFDNTSFSTFYNISANGYRNTSQLIAQYGFPGGICDFVTTEPNADNLGSITPFSWGNYEPTVNENEKTFYFNEKTLGYIDTAVQEMLPDFANWNDVFRSGYVEFTIKTDKKNMIIASGSEEIKAQDLNALFWIFGADLDNGTSITELTIADTKVSNPTIQYEKDRYMGQSFEKALFNLDIGLQNGKISVNYENAYDQNETSFVFSGNTDIADNSWHHVVVNFGRPGLRTSHNTKSNKRTVEIWVDGKLDKQFDEKVNEFQIFYPSLVWLFNSPSKMIKEFFNYSSLDNNFDYQPTQAETPGTLISWSTFGQSFIGYDEFLTNKNIYKVAQSLPESIKRGFRGALHTYAHGHNVPIDKMEIQNRYRLWKKQTKIPTKAFNVSATIVNPTIQTNSKKALKLYWDDLFNYSKFGVELDNNFEVHSYSVINQTKNSKTEIFNLDKSKELSYDVLPDVRLVMTDHVIVTGPEKLTSINKRESFSSNLRVGNRTAAQFVPSSNNLLQVNLFDDSLITDLYFSGVQLESGDRLLLTRQIDDSENGIWVYNGIGKPMTRSKDSFLNDPSKTYLVYVSDGINKGTYWKTTQSISSFNDYQRWSKLLLPNPEFANIDPENTVRWKDYFGNDRLISLQDDLNMSDFDLIVFMNYPETNEDIFNHFPNDPQIQVLKQYQDFINSLRIACSNGANLYISSPKLAEDLGIVKEFTKIEQNIEIGDGRSAAVNPFQFNEPAERYFDTHRQNAYHVNTEVPGLTDKQTWLLTESISYIPKDEYDYEQWHLKYSYRQFGLREGNEFLIPSIPLRQVATKKDLPGFRNNAILDNKLNVVAPQNVLAGTVVTSLANTYYQGTNVTNNPYDDHATTIIVHNGQQVAGVTINGKIFVNCVEDSYTMSREDYNKAIIQVIPGNEPNETNSTRQWQYSTSRLNRLPRRINVKELTIYGQTTPTNGGGGPLIQAATNSANGIIRSETDKNNKDYESDLYPETIEEIYPIQEIPVLSMTWLGLQWLAG